MTLWLDPRCPMCDLSGRAIISPLCKCCNESGRHDTELHYHVECQLCRQHYLIFRKHVTMASKTYYVRYQLIGHKPVETEHFDNYLTAVSVQGKLASVFSELINYNEIVEGNSPCGGHSSLEQPIQILELSEKIAALERELLAVSQQVSKNQDSIV